MTRETNDKERDGKNRVIHVHSETERKEEEGEVRGQDRGYKLYTQRYRDGGINSRPAMILVLYLLYHTVPT